MATRGKLIVLGEKKCKACYVHYGGDLASNLMYGGNEEGLVEKAFEEAKKEGWDYVEVTEPGEIKKLFNYDADFIWMDAALDIFILPDGHMMIKTRIDQNVQG